MKKSKIKKCVLSYVVGRKFEGSNLEQKGTRFLRIFNWYVVITWHHILYMYMWLPCLRATMEPWDSALSLWFFKNK